MKIFIIDYNTGNIGSILNIVKRIGYSAVVIKDPAEVTGADKIILPGVGHFDYGMKELKKNKFIPKLEEAVFNHKIPIMGICLGAQLLTKASEEGSESGLGWFNASTKKFTFTGNRIKKLPHMGWSNVQLKKDSKLFKDMYDNPRFYFVHTYHLVPDNLDDILVSAEYGYEFAAGLEKNNILSVQFHPEKSHKYGMKLLSNFIENY